MTRNADHVVKTGEQSADNPYTFIMSAEKADRSGDIVRAGGWMLRDFKRNPVGLFGHDHTFPIGSWKNVRVEGTKLMGDLVFAKAGTSDRIDEIRSLVEQRVLKAVSVGFRVHDYEPVEKDDPWGAWDIKKQELVECSVCAVGMHQDALLAASAELGVSRATQKLLMAGLKSAPNQSPPVGNATSRDYSDLLGASSLDVRAARRSI